ncbi:MAG: outer membrane lipoprotein-sorting protein [Pseudomonadales bacterium]|nr:outer membrane lipoprotein-sorting protein [Pseudomonadales bacterium]
MVRQLVLGAMFAVLPLALAAESAMAETSEERGLAIAVEADSRGVGFIDSKSSMEMILRNKRGDESRRKLRVKTLEKQGDGDMSLTIFDTPRDQKGTALLTHTHKDRSDDQWLYLPALKRVKKIASKNKSGPFVGSEFAFEDMSAQEVEKYKYKWLRDETLEGQECFVIERYPVDKNSGYTRHVAWIDKAEYRTIQVEFYDRKKSLLKTLKMTEYAKFKDKFWQPLNLSMQNHQTGKSTELLMSNVSYQTGLKESDFSKNSLKRAR